jgi:crotonobetainyl-CoA:carnitine CoA-transferase CaiB-like acyl-CoA transferase
MYEKPEDTILAGYGVLDLTDAKGMFGVRLLAGMGAEVVRIDPEGETKRFRKLLKTADVLIESYTPGYLKSLGFDYRTLSQINPRLIMASITHFGQNGHYKDYKSSDLVDQALGGWLSVTGEAKSPLKLFGNQAYHTASLFAVNGILLAFWQRHTTGRGQYLDVSIMECVTATLDHILPRYFYEGIVSGRQGSLHWNNAFRVFPCKDGYILLSLHQQWETLVEWLASEGMAVDLTDEKWRDREERNRNVDHITEVLEKWTLSHKVEELVEKGQLMRFPWAEVAASSRKDK